MTECVPFLKVADVSATIQWYQAIGFSCVATNLAWEPDGELNWARLEWEGAAFMIGPAADVHMPAEKDASLWFNVATIQPIVAMLQQQSIGMNLEPETFYGRTVVSFRDLNGFTISFSSALV